MCKLINVNIVNVSNYSQKGGCYSKMVKEFFPHDDTRRDYIDLLLGAIKMPNPRNNN
jgi:hypothetical protein